MVTANHKSVISPLVERPPLTLFWPLIPGKNPSQELRFLRDLGTKNQGFSTFPPISQILADLPENADFCPKSRFNDICVFREIRENRGPGEMAFKKVLNYHRKPGHIRKKTNMHVLIGFFPPFRFWVHLVVDQVVHGRPRIFVILNPN